MTDEQAAPLVVNVNEVQEEGTGSAPWGQAYKVLTPAMRSRGGTLGVNQTRLPPGCVGCPFHYHQREDEVFFVLSGRGVLRYGDTIRELRPGDCVSCPAGTKTAHQIANPYDEDLVYLAIGPHDPDEVCVYPDNDKVFVRNLQRVGWLKHTDYMAGEPDPPKIFALHGRSRAAQSESGGGQ